MTCKTNPEDEALVNNTLRGAYERLATEYQSLPYDAVQKCLVRLQLVEEVRRCCRRQNFDREWERAYKILGLPKQ
jgi:hypothetical protein